MKIILSRKGFDSANGGQASPILPDGTMLYPLARNLFPRHHQATEQEHPHRHRQPLPPGS